MRWHRTIVALARALTLVNRVNEALSTRGTGDTLLLADPMTHVEFPRRPPRGS
jgi:hypothetical protein